MKQTYIKPQIQTMTSAEVVEAMGPVQGYGQSLKGSGSSPSKTATASTGPFAISRN